MFKWIGLLINLKIQNSRGGMEFYPEDTQNFVLARKSKKKIEGSIIVLLDLIDGIIVFF